MTVTLAKGQNMPVSADNLRVTVETGSPADLSALLVTPAGTVRSDTDLVFYNQPEGPGVALCQPSPGTPSRIDLQLSAVPGDIDKVRIVVSLADTGTRFGQFAAPVARLTDGAGSLVAVYPISGLDAECIVVAVEVYRKSGVWKARAVGQGYAGGFDELISDHGVVVEREPAMAVAAPAALAAPATPVLTTGRRGAPVSLSKGQRVSLAKQDGSTLTTVRMGLGWDAVKKKGLFGGRSIDIDLDASAVLCSGGQPVDVVFYNQLRSKDGSIRHTGDNLTGDGAGDDESIIVNLSQVPAHVDTILFTVTSYQGHTFLQVENAFCRLVDESTRTELARYTLSGGARSTGMVMAKVYRDGTGWKMHAIGEAIQAKTPQGALPALRPFL